MLDPRARGALLEALRPPPGYVVDAAIATTYSLDLVALLTAPLAFSLFDRLAGRENGPERLDSFVLLHAVRQHAERLVVFCESGCIAKPKGYRQLLTYLEDSVVQVGARRENGVFHPKVWITRLTSDTGPVRYRVLCLSRNLTFDRSWDTMLTLDGELIDRSRAIADSKPLAEFVEALPELAVRAVRASQRSIVERMGDELRRVRFEVPEPFESFRFWPLGLADRAPDPFEDVRVERLLVVSPFLAASRLRRLAGQGRKHVLVSRIDELEAIPKDVLAAYSEVHILHDAAEDLDGEPSDEPADARGASPVPPARGLHAKLYVANDGWNAHVWTGSANASEAAFGANVEMLVQLTGKKSKIGVDEILGEDGTGLRSLLVPFKPPPAPVLEGDLEKQLAEVIRLANRALSRASWTATVVRNGDPSETTETFTVTLGLERGELALPHECAIRVWPITLPDDRAVKLDESAVARFERCSIQALTAFFAFEIAATAGARVERCTFVVRVPLVGAPEDRNARVLHSLLDDPAKVLRFLRMLLSLDAFEALEVLDPEDEHDTDGAENGAGAGASSYVPLFESLVRTLEREPARLVEVDRLVRELRRTPEGAKLLPPDFERVWTPLWAAFQSLEKGRKST